MKKFALVLFDADGCTTITESKRLLSVTGKIAKSSRVLLYYEGKPHAVEVLDFADDCQTLEAADDELIQTHRGQAITQERDSRLETNSRRIRGGYLDVWPAERDLPDAVSFDIYWILIPPPTKL